jgi:hypothetical protein
VPVRATVCGLPVALSVIVTLAVRVPAALGVKTTYTAQLLPAARVDEEGGQVVEAIEKSLALVPVMAILERVTAAVPVLKIVKPC